jgi:hypothetical protein
MPFDESGNNFTVFVLISMENSSVGLENIKQVLLEFSLATKRVCLTITRVRL